MAFITSSSEIVPAILLFGIFSSIFNIIMGIAVANDAKNLQLRKTGLFLFGPVLWGLLTLVFGLSALALYWVIHHSTLRNQRPPSARLQD